MITIKDIAKLAGVSHGTVSNVLNGRGNVSLEKIMLVENAAKQLGYSINERGQQLRNPVQLQMGVVLPNIRDERYSIVYSTLSSYLRDHGGSCTLYLTMTSRTAKKTRSMKSQVAGCPAWCWFPVSPKAAKRERCANRKSRVRSATLPFPAASRSWAAECSVLHPPAKRRKLRSSLYGGLAARESVSRLRFWAAFRPAKRSMPISCLLVFIIL